MESVAIYCAENDCSSMDFSSTMSSVFQGNAEFFVSTCEYFTTNDDLIDIDSVKLNNLVLRMDSILEESNLNMNLVCADTDGGVNEYARGAVSGDPSIMFSGDYATDYCIENTLREYYLDGCQIKYQDIACSFACNEGACIAQQQIDCSTYGTGFFCGTAFDYEGQCQSIGEFYQLSGECNSQGDKNCMVCRQISE